MIELFADINDNTKNNAEAIWNLSHSLLPEKAAKFLSEYTGYASPREQEFLEFYFNLKMEQTRNENNNSIR